MSNKKSSAKKKAKTKTIKTKKAAKKTKTGPAKKASSKVKKVSKAENKSTKQSAKSSGLPQLDLFASAIVKEDKAALKKYAKILIDMDHPLGPLMEADLASKIDKKKVQKLFKNYIESQFGSRYSQLIRDMGHFSQKDDSSGLGIYFRYGFVTNFDNFNWDSNMNKKLFDFLKEEECQFVKDVCIRDLKLKELEFLKNLIHIRQLDLLRCDIGSLKNLKPLSQLKDLMSLGLKSMKVTDLSSLKDLPIVQLLLPHSGNLDLSPLQGMKTLADLGLNNSKVKSLKPIIASKSICAVDLYDIAAPDSEVEELMKSMKKNKNKPIKDQTYLINGYEPYLSHNNIEW